jgi:O-antigen/teichoic acid export membrane protein
VSLVKNSVITSITQWLMFGLSIIYNVALARYFGPEGKGQTYLILLIPTIIVLITNAGLGHALTYYIGKSIKEKKDYSKYVNLTSTLLIVSYIPIVLIFVAITIFCSRILNLEFNIYSLIIILFFVPLKIYYYFLGYALLGQGNLLKYNLILLIEPFIQLVFTAIFISFLSVNVYSVVYSSIISYVVTALVATIFVYKPLQFRFILHLPTLKDMFIYGRKIYFAQLTQFFNYRFDVFIVGYYLGAAEVGLYSVAVALAEVIWKLPNSVAIVIFSRVSSQNTNKSRTPFISRLITFLVVVTSIGLIIFSKFIINIVFGKEFISSLEAFIWLIPGIIGLSIFKILFHDLAASGYPGIGSKATLLSLILTLIFDLVLIPGLGIKGAAIASTIAYLASTFLVARYFINLNNLKYRDIFILTKGDIIETLAVIKEAKRRVLGEFYEKF